MSGPQQAPAYMATLTFCASCMRRATLSYSACCARRSSRCACREDSTRTSGQAGPAPTMILIKDLHFSQPHVEHTLLHACKYTCTRMQMHAHSRMYEYALARAHASPRTCSLSTSCFLPFNGSHLISSCRLPSSSCRINARKTHEEDIVPGRRPHMR